MKSCSPVREENPQSLTSGSSYVQVDNMVHQFYSTYISVDLAHHEIFRKGGISSKISCADPHSADNARQWPEDSR